jgi:succinate dehydrogenase / fumarate reductase, flavoprotein subunit
MMIYPAVHYTMGGLWVDYNLMTNVPGTCMLWEKQISQIMEQISLGASALMQGLADGYFVIPYTVGDYLAQISQEKTPGCKSSRIFKSCHGSEKFRISSVVTQYQRQIKL